MINKRIKSEEKTEREYNEKTRDKQRAQERRFKTQTHSSKHLTF